MKKVIFGILLAICFNGMAIAFDCPSGEAVTEETCSAVAGCIFKAGSCQKCDNGKYSPANKNECLDCARPDNATWLGPGNAANSCPWQLSCPAGTYWNSNTKKCEHCAGNQESSGQTITFNGVGNWPDSNNSCTYTAVLIKLEKNQGVFDIDKQVYAKCNVGFADKASGPWRATPKITPTLWWGQTFYGYYTEQSGGAQKFTANGGLANGVTACDFNQPEQTLYAHWERNPYSVEYYYGTETTASQTQNCYLGENCFAYEPINSKIAKGYYFEYWTCESGCSGTFNKGDKITEPQPTPVTNKPVFKLRAKISECDAGYYCTNGEKKVCPLGSTSEKGAAEITECVFKRGTDPSPTRFCDSGGCFVLPGSGELKHR